MNINVILGISAVVYVILWLLICYNIDNKATKYMNAIRGSLIILLLIDAVVFSISILISLFNFINEAIEFIGGIL